MRFRKIGNSEISVPVVAFGAWAIGGWMWGGTDEKEAIRAVHGALENGMNFIDTAPIYGYGQSEELVGKAIKGRRDKVILATKCGLRWDLDEPAGEVHFYGNEKGIVEKDEGKPVYRYLNPDSIRYEVEQSLKRLQTDYIDLYQTHWQDATTPIERTMAELLKLKDEGKIRAIGVSNATPEQMKEYGHIQSAQEKFNLFQRDNEENGRLAHCRENGLAFLAYSPIAQGLLTGKFDPDQRFPEGDVRNINPLFNAQNIRRVNAMLDEWQPLCEKHDATPAQLAAAWTFEYPGVTHVLLGTRTVKQAVENAAAGSIDLSRDDIDTMNRLYTKYFGSV